MILLDNLMNVLLLRKLWKYKRPKAGSRAVIFVDEKIHERGGVASRTLTYANGLMANGILPVFVTRSMNNPQLAQFPFIKLRFQASNFTNCVLAVANYFRAQTVEVQITCREALESLDIDKIRGHVRTGMMIHGNIEGLDSEALNTYDYRIVVSPSLPKIDYKALNSFDYIPNAVVLPPKTVWEYRAQKKALIFSRIAMDKAVGLINVINLFKRQGIDFDVVGQPDAASTIEHICRETGVSADKFQPINVDGQEFMASHGDEYLFVAGVGLVLLEAGALGFPCMIISEISPDRCTFVTADILKKKVFPNLSYIRITLEREAVINNEFSLDNLQQYALRPVIEEDYSIDSLIQKYISVTFPV